MYLRLLFIKPVVLIKTLLTLYRMLICSKLDYGAIVYSNGHKSYLKTLEPVASQALRICIGAYRTSPVSSLQVLAHEPPLELHREKLSLQGCTDLTSTELTATHKTVSNQSSRYHSKSNAVPSLGLHIHCSIPAIHSVTAT